MIDDPLISVVLPTRDRPSFLSIALRCYREQIYTYRELIVMDDGERFPVDEAAVTACGGRLIRLAPGTLLGEKLNVGLAAARGAFCHKMDDDDYYAPAFLDRLAAAALAQQTMVCRPVLVTIVPYLFFDPLTWKVHWAEENQFAGGALLFGRDDWLQRPFRGLPDNEDNWFFWDQIRSGVEFIPVARPDLFLQVRHRGGARDRGHTWTRYHDGRPVDAYVRARPGYRGGPRALLPPWALAAYRGIREEQGAARHDAPVGSSR